MPTALVTGATGLVGSHIIERLDRDGWDLRALVREGTLVRTRHDGWDGSAWLRQRRVELRRGDILDLTSFVDAARNCDVIFHTAAAITPRTHRVHPYDAYRVPNVDGTRNAIAAAAKTGARLLHLSSVAVYGPHARYASADVRRVDETMSLDPLPEHAYYARSKREAEALVMTAHGEGRIWATAVRPDVIYGPRDRQFIPRVARLLRFGLAPVLAGGRAVMAIVHAAHVADGAVRAASREAAGGRAYNLANDFDLRWREFYTLAAIGLERRIRIFSLAPAIARLGLAMAQPLLRAMNVDSKASLDFMARDNPFSSERARHDLGWSPQRCPDESVPEAFRWWKEHHR